ncbi:MAG: GAF domain-containing protein, partial [Bacteroidetes bacterium]|nr:GAF domain-containing protein [Bacteroidota bacterium]
MKTKQRDSPLHVKIGFNKLFDAYRAKLNSSSELIRSRAKEVLDIAAKYPILTEGLTTETQVKKYKKQIDLITEDLFSSVLQENEIKIATIPFQAVIFRSSQRYKNIITNAGEGFELEILNFDDSNFFLMGCSIILNSYYGYKTDFKRPFYYEIPDKNGILRSYRILFNGDFIEIEKTDKSLEITEEDYLELLENFDNVDVWKKKFPPNSWNFKGFVIANMYDATVDVSLADFKAGLLDEGNSKKETFIHDFRKIIKSIFNLPDLKVGYTVFNNDEDEFEQMSGECDVNSYLLNGKDRESSKSALCNVSHSALLKEHRFYCISDVDHYHELYPKNVLYKKLADQKIKSAIIASLVSEGKVLGVMEIVSPNKQELNTINANKLLDIIPYLIDSIKREKKREEDEIELLIQKECTSIHSSVHWKFRKEAKRVLETKARGEEASFKEIVFENVYPLFGQIDIKGSSNARNIATKNDLILQLHHVKKIIDKIYRIEALPIYEQINFRID